MQPDERFAAADSASDFGSAISNLTTPSSIANYIVRCDDDGSIRIGVNGPSAAPQSLTFVDDHQVAGAFGSLLPPLLADLIDLAVATYCADRLCRRQTVNGRWEPQWQRRIALSLPVRDLARWSDLRLRSVLMDVLSAFTDDEWVIEFRQRAHLRRQAESQTQLFTTLPDQPAVAALFSGGLDSLAGLVTWLDGHPQHTVATFSARTTSRIGAHQRRLLDSVATAYPGRLRRVSVQFGLHRRAPRAFDREERSQRTRGFVFQMVGAAIAWMAGLDRLLIFENGIGAINLPYTAAQVGSQATRAAHPAVLERVSGLLSLLFEQPFIVQLPYALRTKGELCTALRSSALLRRIGATISCDSYPQRVAGVEQCGHCTSCLLRRQALFAAGLRHADQRSLYIHDIYDSITPDAWSRRFYFRAMSAQVHHLHQALTAQDPWSALIMKYPELVEVAGALGRDVGGPMPSDVHHAITNLFRRYVTEWRNFAAEVHPGAPAATGPVAGH